MLFSTARKPSVHSFPAEMVLIYIRFFPKAPFFLRTVLLCQKQTLNGWSLRSRGFHSSALPSSSGFCSSRSRICYRSISQRLTSSAPVCARQLSACFLAGSGPVKKFHTSAGLRAPPAVVLWLLVKPVQKVIAIILGRWDTLHTTAMTKRWSKLYTTIRRGRTKQPIHQLSLTLIH